MRGLWFLLCIIVSNGALSQNIDSIKNEMNYNFNDTIKLKSALYLSDYYSKRNIDKMLEYAKTSYEIASKINDKKSISIAQLKMGNAYTEMSDIVNGEKYLKEALEKFKQLDYKEGVSDCYGNLAVIYSKSGKYQEAMQYLNLSNDLRLDLNKYDKYLKGLQNIAKLHLQMQNIDKAKEIYLKAIQFAKDKKLDKDIASVFNDFSGYYYRIGKLDSAIVLLNFAKDANTKNKDIVSLARNYYNIGLNYFLKKEYEESYHNLVSARDNFKIAGLEDWIQRTNMLISSVLEEKGDVDMALVLHGESIEFFKKHNMTSDLANAYANYAIAFRKSRTKKGRKDDPSVIDTMNVYLSQALFYFKKSNQEDKAIDIQFDIAKNDFFIGKYQKSIDEINKLIPVFEKNKQKDNLIFAQWFLGKNLSKLNDIKSAITHYEKAKTLAKTTDAKILEQTFYKELGDLYFLDGEIMKSNENLKQSLIERDSLYKTKRDSNLYAVEMKYQAKEKTKENLILAQENKNRNAIIKKQKTIVAISVLGLIIISALAFFLYDQNRKRKKANELLKKQKTEIELLNNELNHRVKNNLAFMTSLLSMQGRRLQSTEAKSALKESESRLQALSVVHNNLMKNSLGKEVNLREYILQIVDKMKESFYVPGKQIEVTTEVDDIAIDAERAMRIGLVVNELFTNSVKYAFQDIGQPNIHISLKQQGKSLSLIYKDNGPGFQQGFENVTGVQEQPQHLGSKLIHLLVEQMQGSLKVTGSEFLSTLPVV